MKLINRYGPCIGISLFRFRRTNYELWWCPAAYEIPEHCHPNQHIELRLIFGRTEFFRRSSKSGAFESAPAQFPADCGRVYSVPAGYFHKFNTGKCPLVFINKEQWLEGVEITSAATDFRIN